MTEEEVREFSACVARGGLALFPADTVYGLATDPESRAGVERLYRLKGRAAAQPAAVMFFSLDALLESVPGMPPRIRSALGRLLPGPVTLVVPNPRRRFPLACGPDPERLGLRVPALAGVLSPFAAMERPVLQSSANRSGRPDVRRLRDVEPEIRSGVDVELDGGDLPGTPSTVVDLSTDDVRILREGALPAAAVQRALADGGA